MSTFTAHYIYQWSTYFPSTPLEPSSLPSFDGRAVLYPATRHLRDYMSWRQVDCQLPCLVSQNESPGQADRSSAGHINNLYNTTFWAMVQQGGMNNVDAERELQVSRPHYLLGQLILTRQGTVSSDKNEILFKRFGINYNNEPEMYKKGSVVYRQVSTAKLRPVSCLLVIVSTRGGQAETRF